MSREDNEATFRGDRACPAKHGWVPCDSSSALPAAGAGAPARRGSSGQGACGPRGARLPRYKGFSCTCRVRVPPSAAPGGRKPPSVPPSPSWLPGVRGAGGLGETARRSGLSQWLLSSVLPAQWRLSGRGSPAPRRFLAALHLLCRVLHGSRHFPQPLPATPVPRDSLKFFLFNLHRSDDCSFSLLAGPRLTQRL